MMEKVFIWVEGIADQHFVGNVIKKWMSIDFNIEKQGKGKEVYILENEKMQVRIQVLGSVSVVTEKTAWENNRKQDFEDNYNKGYKNLIIIDSDHSATMQVNKVRATVTNVAFNPDEDLYMWPDKSSGRGNLEDLLVKIINVNHEEVISCFEKYEKCLSYQGKGYSTPDMKAKIYSYAQALTGKGNENQRDYTNEDHWNLDHKTEPLKPLYDFLNRHIGVELKNG